MLRRVPWFALAGCLALALGVWWRTRTEPRPVVEGFSPAAARESASAAAQLEVPSVPATAVSAAVSTSREAREGVAGREPVSVSAPVHGRLVDAEDQQPLPIERLVLLSSPGDAVAESVRTQADGSFTSQRSFPKARLRAWVRDPSGQAEVVRHEADFDPTLPGEWRIPIPRVIPEAAPEIERENGAALLRGRIVDLTSQGVQNAQVRLIPLAPRGALVFMLSAEDGAFGVDGLEPGFHRLCIQARFHSLGPIELELVPGENDLGVLVLPALPAAGTVRGQLLAEGLGDDPSAVLFLRERESGRELAGATGMLFSSEHTGRASFAFEDVPPGDYELSLLPLDGRRYEPERLRVSPPVEGLEFRARNEVPRAYVLRVLEASSGRALQPFMLLARLHGQWWTEEGDEARLLPDTERWVVCAVGHRPAQGDLAGALENRNGERGEEGERLFELQARLEPGFALALVFKDLESDRLLQSDAEERFAPGLAGVEVRADGRRAAESGTDGLALLDLAAAPREITYARPGWRVLREEQDEGVRWVFLVRE